MAAPPLLMPGAIQFSICDHVLFPVACGSCTQIVRLAVRLVEAFSIRAEGCHPHTVRVGKLKVGCPYPYRTMRIRVSSEHIRRQTFQLFSGPLMTVLMFLSCGTAFTQRNLIGFAMSRQSVVP